MATPNITSTIDTLLRAALLENALAIAATENIAHLIVKEAIEAYERHGPRAITPHVWERALTMSADTLVSKWREESES